VEEAIDPARPRQPRSHHARRGRSLAAREALSIEILFRSVLS